MIVPRLVQSAGAGNLNSGRRRVIDNRESQQADMMGHCDNASDWRKREEPARYALSFRVCLVLVSVRVGAFVRPHGLRLILVAGTVRNPIAWTRRITGELGRACGLRAL